ncbi:aminotransferase class V-fold PLP-dependent enzyme [soil metagenome]
MVEPFLPEPEKVAAVRGALPATSAGIYLNTGSAGPLPAETARGMEQIADRQLRVGRATPADLEDVLDRMDEARGVLAALVGGDPAEISLTHGTTDGMNIAAWAPDWRRGDRIVTSDLEHPGGLAPLLAVRDRLGLELAVVEVAGATDDSDILEAFERKITPRTRLVAVSHVSWSTGLRLPIPEIADLARRRDAWFAVDGAQSAGAVPLDMASLGADLFAFSGHKWLLGPEGTGGLWAGPRARAEARRASGGALGHRSVSRQGCAVPWTDARRFEHSTLHPPSVVGLARSVGWLEMYVGLGWVHDRGLRLARELADSLGQVPGVTVLAPPALMGTLVSFRVAGWTAEDLLEALASRIFAIMQVVPDFDAVRASVGFFNTDEELARLVEAVREVARHTPDTLPRRPTLVVLPAGSG